jgi:hypothetical protein
LLQSAKEYAAKKRKVAKKKAPVKKKRTPKAGVKKRAIQGGDEQVPVSQSVSTPIDKPAPQPKVFEYSFFHPDNPRDEYINRAFDMRVGNDVFKVDIVNGVVKTTIEALARKLHGLGWSIIHKREVTSNV